MKNAKALRSLPWFIAVISLIVAASTTFLWISAETELNKGNITAQKDEVRAFCLNPDTASQADCKRELDSLSRMLIDLQKEMKKAKQGTTLPESSYTITPEMAPVGQ